MIYSYYIGDAALHRPRVHARRAIHPLRAATTERAHLARPDGAATRADRRRARRARMYLFFIYYYYIVFIL